MRDDRSRGRIHRRLGSEQAVSADRLQSARTKLTSKSCRRFTPVSRKNKHLYKAAPGSAIFVVDAANLAHFEFKASRISGSWARRVAKDTKHRERDRLEAQGLDEDMRALESKSAERPFMVYAAPATDPKASRVLRWVGYHECIAILNVKGNEKGRNSHTVGPTRIEMSNGVIVQPPPIWRIDDAATLTRLHSNPAQQSRQGEADIREPEGDAPRDDDVAGSPVAALCPNPPPTSRLLRRRGQRCVLLRAQQLICNADLPS